MMTNEEKAVAQFMNRGKLPFVSPCGCMGPQNGDPLCPCAMEWTEIVDGFIYKISYEKGGFKATLVSEVK